MINHLPQRRPQRLITRTCPTKSDAEIVLFGVHQVGTGQFADGSRCCREVVDIGLPPGATESNGPPPRTAESEPLAHAVPLSATSAGMPPLAECLLGGASAPSANSLTSNSVWTCRRAMTGQKRDGGRRRTRALYTEAYKRERRRQGRGWVVLMAGVVIGATHVVIHLGQLRFLPSAGWQDLAVGYPMAMVLALVGLMMIASRTRKPRGEYCGLAPVICSAARGISSHRAGCQRHGRQQGHYW